jgi:hypothetical protein
MVDVDGRWSEWRSRSIVEVMVDGEPGSNWVFSLGKKSGYLKNPIYIQSKKVLYFILRIHSRGF